MDINNNDLRAIVEKASTVAASINDAMDPEVEELDGALQEIAGFAGLPENISFLVQKSLLFLENIISGETDFDSAYEKISRNIDRIHYLMTADLDTLAPNESADNPEKDKSTRDSSPEDIADDSDLGNIDEVFNLDTEENNEPVKTDDLIVAADKLDITQDDLEEIEIQLYLFESVSDSFVKEGTHLLDSVEYFCEKIVEMPARYGAMSSTAREIIILVSSIKEETTSPEEGARKLKGLISRFESEYKEVCAIHEYIAEEEDEPGAEDLVEQADRDLFDEEEEKETVAIVEEPEPAPEKEIERGESSLDPGFDSDNPELTDFVIEAGEYLDDAEAALIALEQDKGNFDLINEIFRNLHNVKGIAGFVNIVHAQKLAHAAESMLDKTRRKELEFTDEIAGLSLEIIDVLRSIIGGVKNVIEGDVFVEPPEWAPLMEKMSEAKKTGKVKSVPKQKPAAKSNENVKKEIVEERSPEKKPRASASIENVRRAEAQKKAVQQVHHAMETMIKVGTTRLDNLIDAVGELVIATSLIVREVEEREDPTAQLAQNVTQLDNITRDLQELAMSIRMVSLQPTFRKMARVARDISARSSRKIKFEFSGEETEIDRNVVEAITSPLVHMVRNAVDHGIDPPERRRELGKPETGNISLTACHEGGNVVIRLKDDGRGLRKARILEQARKIAIIDDDTELSDKAILNLIFHPGFSTAKKVTDVSGRGVGMDVVRKNIEQLQGRIEIQSVEDEGTTFTIRLPLTLAIMDGMVIRSGEEVYVLPTISIQESLRPEKQDLTTAVNEGKLLNIRGSLIPIFSLAEMFEIEGAKENPLEALMLVMGDAGEQFALMVDDLIGQQQVVIKSLGNIIERPHGIAGGAIMGDGNVALILESRGLLRLAHER